MWFISSVDELVFMEGTALCETPPTLRAAIRFLASVDSLVLYKNAAFYKPLLALRALIRLLPRVDALVSLEVALAGEVLPTLRTVVGFFSGVNPLVLFEITLFTETLPTHRTGVYFFFPGCVRGMHERNISRAFVRTGDLRGFHILTFDFLRFHLRWISGCGGNLTMHMQASSR